MGKTSLTTLPHVHRRAVRQREKKPMKMLLLTVACMRCKGSQMSSVTKWEFGVWDIIFRYPYLEWKILSSLSVCGVSPFNFLSLRPLTTVTDDFHLELASWMIWGHSPSENYLHFWHWLQVLGVPKTSARFDSFLKVLGKLTGSHYANNYVLL